jgi:ATP-dependent Lon protease
MKYTSFKDIPVLPIRNTVLFPGSVLSLRVGRPKSVAALQAAKKRIEANQEKKTRDSLILILTQKSEQDAEATEANLYHIGTLAKIETVQGNLGQGYQVLVRGMERLTVLKLTEAEGMLLAEAESTQEVIDIDEGTKDALLANIKNLSQEILELIPGDTSSLQELIYGINDLVFLADLCAANLQMPVPEKQELLEIISIKFRVLKLLEIMQRQKEQLQVQSDIREKISQKFGKTQREHFLREQLKAIKEELGEDGGASDVDLQKKIDEAGMPSDVKQIAIEELKRLETIGTMSSESHVIRNYIDLLCALPWSKASTEDIDLEIARTVLDREHSGLEKVKSRIIQHLAVLKLSKNIKGSILLFVGPPGVGKTSLGQSIAEALGKKFARASLGGLRDDAEIRGHRRTYVGAMPGRIIQAIKRVEQNNPVFMLDEIDKLANSFQGDPASALLEVLDPEQNAKFLDHFLDVPFDLSKVFFIATANTTDTIPRPLLDRMEVIELSGYTTTEKLHIAKTHLLPHQLIEHGLKEDQIQISDDALLVLINSYTREAGVRELQRKIASICRVATEKVLKPNFISPLVVDQIFLEEALGPEKFIHEIAERLTPPGVVTGLAWTPMGGEILFIESALMPGTGRLKLTGQLGDVMKESAEIALSLVRSRITGSVPKLDFEHQDIHIHIPAGAIPKDGPSAGVTLVTALASLLTNKSVNPKLAMTGEITLRGIVTPVGGIKEKVLAAHRAGIEHVILCRRNKKDLSEVPKEVISKMQFDFVDTIQEVLKIALGVEVLSPTIGYPVTPEIAEVGIDLPSHH